MSTSPNATPSAVKGLARTVAEMAAAPCVQHDSLSLGGWSVQVAQVGLPRPARPVCLDQRDDFVTDTRPKGKSLA